MKVFVWTLSGRCGPWLLVNVPRISGHSLVMSDGAVFRFVSTYNVYVKVLPCLVVHSLMVPLRLDRESDMAALLEATRPALKDVLGKVYSMSRDQVKITLMRTECTDTREFSWRRAQTSDESSWPWVCSDEHAERA